jgi:cysteine desulfurase family protein (TIGR01976 family)
MTTLREIVPSLRGEFPALSRSVNGRPAVYFDGPAGTQVPRRVIDAITDYLSHRNANHEGHFVTSQESDQMLAETHCAVADLLGASDPNCVFFGPNMTTLTLALSRSISTRWSSSDEILVTRMDHDANVSPWVLAAEDAGARVRFVGLRATDCTLDVDSLRSQLSERTKLVAVGCASNATGTVNPIAEIVKHAHEVGALVFLDAVHYAPHALIDVEGWGCDFLACSAYKFYGPHIGIMWGRRHLLEDLPAYKLRPVPDDLPGKWMSGTQNHECLAGTLAAVNYLADLGIRLGASPDAGRRESLRVAYDAIGQYERELLRHLLDGLAKQTDIKVWGITDPKRFGNRLPTVAITHQRVPASDLAKKLGQVGIFVWHGNYYALELTESLGLEPEGMVRIGLVHYNTSEEVDRLLDELGKV